MLTELIAFGTLPATGPPPCQPSQNLPSRAPLTSEATARRARISPDVGASLSPNALSDDGKLEVIPMRASRGVPGRPGVQGMQPLAANTGPLARLSAMSERLRLIAVSVGLLGRWVADTSRVNLGGHSWPAERRRLGAVEAPLVARTEEATRRRSEEWREPWLEEQTHRESSL